jgi:endonuclease YncB( thermonuclease family)
VRVRRPAPAVIIILLVLAFLAWRGPSRAKLWPEPQPEPRAAAAAGARAGDTVEKIVDGDTVVGKTHGTIRILGIDTPEVDQPLYGEARDALARLIAGNAVELLFDRTTRDSYGRTLAHVLVPAAGDAKVIAGEELLRAGLASVYIIPPNTLFADRFKAAQKEAVMQKRGLWALAVATPESYYVVGAYKFHRPSCRFAAQVPRPRKETDRNAILAEGKSPCRECKP